MNAQELKDTPTDALIDRRASALELIGRRALAFHAAHPRACQVCDGVGLDLKAPAPPSPADEQLSLFDTDTGTQEP